MKDKIYQLLNKHMESGRFKKSIQCDYCQEIYRIYFKLNLNKDTDKLLLEKVGQYPSINEFTEYNITKIEKLLKRIKALDDFRKGCCSESYGLNIGSYTYFRRVLEKRNELNYDKEKFPKLEMDEKL